jgi:MmyB-like transcription regulator ligand binding domain
MYTENRLPNLFGEALGDALFREPLRRNTMGDLDDHARALSLIRRPMVEPRDRDRPATRAQLAQIMGVTERAVQYWDTGRHLPRIHQLPDLVGVLGLTEEESALLFHWRTGRWPSPLLPQAPQLDDHLLAMVWDDPWPVYVTTKRDWHVVAANEAFHAAFPWAPWKVGAPDATLLGMSTTSAAQNALVDHARSWGRPLAGQIIRAWRANPTDPHLYALVTRITGDPRWQHLWRGRGNPPTWRNVSLRQLRHPEWGEGQVALITTELDDHRFLRVTPVAHLHRVLDQHAGPRARRKLETRVFSSGCGATRSRPCTPARVARAGVSPS